MELKAYRYNSAAEHTNSLLMINAKFECYGLEDEHRNVKVWGETRVADGKYPIRFRTVGGFNKRYTKRYTKKFGASFHKGMLEICDVPEFKYILIHIGNDDDDTAGCYLVGETQARGENFIGSSARAYEKMYPKVRDALLRGEGVTIEFITLDRHEG
jgi:hypothetical protein